MPKYQVRLVGFEELPKFGHSIRYRYHLLAVDKSKVGTMYEREAERPFWCVVKFTDTVIACGGWPEMQSVWPLAGMAYVRERLEKEGLLEPDTVLTIDTQTEDRRFSMGPPWSLEHLEPHEAFEVEDVAGSEERIGF